MAHDEDEEEPEGEEGGGGGFNLKKLLVIAVIGAIVIFVVLPRIGGLFGGITSGTITGNGDGQTVAPDSQSGASNTGGIGILKGILSAPNGGGIQDGTNSGQGASGGNYIAPTPIPIAPQTGGGGNPITIPQNQNQNSGGNSQRTVTIGSGVPNYYRAGLALGCSNPVLVSTGRPPANTNIVHNGEQFRCP